MQIDFDQFSKFLVKAKKSTYASSGEEEGRILKNGAKEFEFIQGEFKYRDRYFGYNPFIGEEIVFYKKEPIWGMNYYGKILSEVVSPKEIYRFLQRALKMVNENRPFRGPESFKEDKLKYTNKVRGDIKKFKGEETIFYRREIVYRLTYHGGVILSK